MNSNLVVSILVGAVLGLVAVHIALVPVAVMVSYLVGVFHSKLYKKVK